MCTAGRSTAGMLYHTKAGSVPVSALDRTSKKKFARRKAATAGALSYAASKKSLRMRLASSKKGVRAQSAGMAPDSRLKDALKPMRLGKKDAVKFVADGSEPLCMPKHTRVMCGLLAVGSLPFACADQHLLHHGAERQLLCAYQVGAS